MRMRNKPKRRQVGALRGLPIGDCQLPIEEQTFLEISLSRRKYPERRQAGALQRDCRLGISNCGRDARDPFDCRLAIAVWRLSIGRKLAVCATHLIGKRQTAIGNYLEGTGEGVGDAAGDGLGGGGVSSAFT